jgi:crossover junction endodeoxyribonuclease RuvC
VKQVFIGIDPGQSGGIACIDTERGIHYTVPYSDKDLIDMCRDESYSGNTKHIMCCLEKVGAMPGQGVTGMFNFGVSYGYIKGVLEANRIPYQEIPPQRWKKEFGLNSDKAASVDVCRKLYPDVNLLAAPRCKKPHDGMAEALLMAEYARRKL